MPKFVGSVIKGAQTLAPNATLTSLPPGFVKLTYSQAIRLPAEQVYASLDTTDRGSRGTLAKRWNRWFAKAADVLACPASTVNMVDLAARVLAADEADNEAVREFRAAMVRCWGESSGWVRLADRALNGDTAARAQVLVEITKGKVA